MLPKPILLAEDEQTDALVVERLMRQANVLSPLQIVEDGQAAIAYLSGEGQYADRERFPLPGLILLDLHMPRRSGFDVLEWLRQHPQSWRPPVVVLSGSKNIGDIQRAYDLGANAYLVKPVQSEALLDLVAEFAVVLTASPRVLVLDDNPDDRTVVLRELRREFPGLEAVEAETTQGLTETLQSKVFDLVITDFDLHHGWDGLAAARTVKALWPDCPVIMVTGTGSEEAAVEAMKAGIDDYVLKSPRHIVRLPAAARHALARARRRQVLRKSELDRLRAEAALRQSEARFRGLVEAAPDAILGVDRDGRVALVNDQAERTFGYSRQAMVGQHVEMLLPERLRDTHSAHRADYMEKPLLRPMGIGLQLRGRRRDGSEFPAEISLSPVETDEGMLVMAIVHDITERVRTEAALAESERNYRSLVENALAGVYKTTPGGEILYANDALVRLMGFDTVEDLRAAGAVARYANPQDRDRLLQALRGSGAVTGFEADVLARGGETRSVLLSAALHDGVLSGMMVDITERKRAQEQIERQVQRLSALRTIDMAITGSLDPRVTFGVILDQVTARLGVDAADILLYNPQMLTLEHAAGRGFRTDALRHTRLRLGDGHAGRAALERRVMVVPHLGESEDQFARAPLLAAEGFAAYFAVPLIAKGQVKGVLEIFHRSRLEPDQEWLDFLEAIAGQAAIAIDNAALFDGLQRSNVDLMVAYDSTIEGWSRALDLRDRDTEGHSQRVTEMTLRLARVAGIGEDVLVHVRRGALLHDIGKMGVPDAILHKPGPLTEEEWAIMRRHPVYAHEMLWPIAYLRPALDIPYGHHEKWDGSGYPRGLKAEQIPLTARVFAVADVWDALRSDRPYRPAWPEEQVREYIGEQSGQHFDPAAVEAFLRVQAEPG